MKIKLASVVLLFCILFSSCTVQTDFDVYDFCERYNKLLGEDTIFTGDFLSDNDGKLYCFMRTGKSTVLITLYENEKSSLESLFVTVEKSQYDESDYEEITDIIYRSFASFNYKDAKKAEEDLTADGFDGSFKPFSDEYKSEENGKYRITLFSNEFAFTVSKEKIDSD